MHLWVEGFFEVFATVVIAFLFLRMGLLRPRIGALILGWFVVGLKTGWSHRRRMEPAMVPETRALSGQAR